MLLELDGCKTEEKPLLAPRLVRNLTSRAWEACLDIDREQLRTEKGVEFLLEWLQDRRGKVEVDLLGDALQQYFQSGEAGRRDGENLNDFEQRHSVYVRDIRKAMLDIGCKESVPTEIYGWFVINKPLRLDASDVAMIKAQATSYKLSDVMQTVKKMWGGDSLTYRDADRKKQGNHRTYVTSTEPDWTLDPDPLQSSSVLMSAHDDVESDNDELEESQAWLEHAAAAFAESPQDECVLANFNDAKRTFYKEARRALDKSRVSRGFYDGKSKGKGQSKSKDSSSSGFTGRCMRCGKVGHKAMNCKQSMNQGGSGTSQSRSSDSGRVGFVFAAGTVPDGKDSRRVQFTDDEMSTAAEVQIPNLAVLADETQTKAILDCGASESIVGAHTLQILYDKYQTLGLDPDKEIQVDRHHRRSFIFGNNETSLALGLANVSVGIAGSQLTIPMHIVEGQTPLLLSSRWLEEQEAIIDFKSGLAQFAFSSGNRLQLERASTNHLLLPLTDFPSSAVPVKQVKDQLPHCEAFDVCPSTAE